MSNIIKNDDFVFSFDQNACASCNGACCRGESGYIWVNNTEIKSIAEYLKIDYEKFVQTFLYKEGYRYSIKERKKNGEYLCIFFDEQKGCEIYPVRPKQCRTYPFWDRYKSTENLSEVCAECKGIILDS